MLENIPPRFSSFIGILCLSILSMSVLSDWTRKLVPTGKLMIQENAPEKLNTAQNTNDSAINRKGTSFIKENSTAKRKEILVEERILEKGSPVDYLKINNTNIKMKDTGRACIQRRTFSLSLVEKEIWKRDEMRIPKTYVMGCPIRFAVTFPSGKGMANSLSEYTHIIGFCQRFNCDPYLPDEEYKNLKHNFPNIRLPSLNSLEHCRTKFIVMDAQEVMKLLVQDEAKAKRENYILDNLNNASAEFASYYQKVKNDFTIRKDLNESAVKMINDLKERYQTDTIVGVHVQGMDYTKFLILRTNGHGHFLEKSYYYTSFAFFKSRFPNAVFVIICEDIAWCKENFNNTGYQIEFLRSENYTSSMFEFTLLASCSHSVCGASTFSYWSSFLAGGLVTYPINYTGDERCDVTLPMIENQNFVNWFPLLGADD